MRKNEKKSTEPDRNAWPLWLVFVVAVVIPSVPTINGWFELKLAETAQLHEIRRSYLDRAIDPGRSPRDRAIVFEFLVATLEPSDDMFVWATEELRRLNEYLDLRPKVLEQGVELQNLRSALEEEKGRGQERSQQKIAELELRIVKAQDRIDELQSELRLAREKVTSRNESEQVGSGDRPPTTCCVRDCAGILVCGAHVETGCSSCSVNFPPGPAAIFQQQQ